MRQLISVFVLLCVLAACGSAASVPTPAPAEPTSQPESGATRSESPTSSALPAFAWWDDALFYEVFVRSFFDSDGDGIGDLPGLIEQLDYLNDGDPSTNDDLGVTALWLMPIFASPSYHGYDVTDYYTIDPEYGTNKDILRLMDEAHQRGIRIIIDLVLNHTSDQHPWFVASAAGPNADRRDWYVWSDTAPGYLGPWGQQVWHPKNGSHYYGVFWGGMPDLNLENPDVTAELNEVARFWLEEMGVDGFRLDAAKHFVEDGKQQVHTPETHDWLADFYAFVKSVNPDALLVGEVWDISNIASGYVGDLDLVFEFSLAEAILDGAGRGRATPVVSAMRNIQRAYPGGGYATFLSNHDQTRVVSALSRDPGKAKVAAATLLTLPGVPFAYYGEEIGMTGTKPPDERVRTPMQWSAGENAGFTTGRSWQPVNEDSEAVNVESQAAEPDSMLDAYRLLFALRQAHPALRTGEFYPLESDNSAVYAFLRVEADEAILVVINFDREATSDYVLSLAETPLAPGDYAMTDLLSGEEVASLPVGTGGAIEGFRPLPELPVRAALVLQLTPVED